MEMTTAGTEKLKPVPRTTGYFGDGKDFTTVVEDMKVLSRHH